MANLRARNLDTSKPFPVEFDLDEDENGCAHRPVIELPSGMEVEEEQEAHFKKLMSEMTASKDIAVDYNIPTPEAHRKKNISHAFLSKIPSTYIPYHKTEYTKVEYDATEKDAEFVKSLKPAISIDLFEEIITKLEVLSYNNVLFLFIIFYF